MPIWAGVENGVAPFVGSCISICIAVVFGLVFTSVIALAIYSWWQDRRNRVGEPGSRRTE